MVGTISRDELKNKILKGERLQLVETLPEDKFREQHLPGAVNLPPAEIKQRARQILPDRNESIVVYCGSESCTASLDAARELENEGYTYVRRYAGGKKDWVAAGLPTEGSSAKRQTAMSH